jgi:hypothetical protein
VISEFIAPAPRAGVNIRYQIPGALAQTKLVPPSSEVMPENEVLVLRMRFELFEVLARSTHAALRVDFGPNGWTVPR